MFPQCRAASLLKPKSGDFYALLRLHNHSTLSHELVDSQWRTQSCQFKRNGFHYQTNGSTLRNLLTTSRIYTQPSPPLPPYHSLHGTSTLLIATSIGVLRPLWTTSNIMLSRSSMGANRRLASSCYRRSQSRHLTHCSRTRGSRHISWWCLVFLRRAGRNTPRTGR